MTMDAFDAAAATYDAGFTASAIGAAQRGQVWRALAPLLAAPPMRVLELNCGTGADAVHMARAGHAVLATDRSGAMLAIARDRVRRAGLDHLVRTAMLDLREPVPPAHRDPYDLVLSDMGGLNCIDAADLARLGRSVADSLRPGGRFVAVLMADRCLLEVLYHLLLGRPSAAFRRWTREAVDVPVGGGMVRTWYHPPVVLRDAFAPLLTMEHLRPIGLFVPPGYLEPRVRHRPRLLRQLDRLDRLASRTPGLARLGDHFLIQFRRRS